MPRSTQTFVGLRQAAGQLGVPMAFLRREAIAGRVPHIRAGRSLRFDVEAVADVLRQRAREGAA